MTWNDDRIFAALCTSIKKDGDLLLKSNQPVTCEISENSIKYCHCNEVEVVLGMLSKPKIISVNDNKIKDFKYNKDRKEITFILPAGEGVIKWSD